MTNLYLKFDVSYSKIKTLPSQFKKQFTTEEKYVAITILEIIIRNLNKNNIQEAYLTLLKAFNVTRVFDRVMIFYLRFLLYEYISDNQNKLFKKDFPVCLGNLLPEEYETPEGKFLYNDYFLKDLLKFYTCAEKLAVFLVPYVLKVNLNIVFYYFGNECDIENKFFSCELPNKDKRLDIKKSGINIFAQFFVAKMKSINEINNLSIDIINNIFFKIFNDNIQYFLKNEGVKSQQERILNKISPFDEDKSMIFNRVLFEKQRNEANQKKEEKLDKNDNNFNIEDSEKNKMFIYVKIINNNANSKCFICDKTLEKEDEKETLPCKCIINFCSEECKNNYYKYLISFINLMEFNLNIKCGRCNNIINRIKFIENLNLENESLRKSLKKKMIEFYNNYCMNCLNPVADNAKKIKCKCPKLHKLLDNNKASQNLILLSDLQ